MRKTILAALLIASTAAAYEALSTGPTEAVPVALAVHETPRQSPSRPTEPQILPASTAEPAAPSGVIRDAPSDGGYSYYQP